MADYRQRPYPCHTAGMNYRPAMPTGRMGYTRPAPSPVPVPEAACEPEKPEVCEKQERQEVAMAYIPWQKWKKTYDLDKALEAGTLFPELDKKFYYAGGGCR